MTSRYDEIATRVELPAADDEWLSIEDLARACCMSVEWVQRHIEDEVIEASWQDGRRLVGSRMVWRARRIAELERQFDADPQLAALVADLIDELHRLRRHLALLEAGQP
jgi:chaperone modulatory protein CbpM